MTKDAVVNLDGGAQVQNKDTPQKSPASLGSVPRLEQNEHLLSGITASPATTSFKENEGEEEEEEEKGVC